MKQRKLIFNFFVNRNWKKLADSRKRAKILADNRKCHHPIETLLQRSYFLRELFQLQKRSLQNSFSGVKMTPDIEELK